MQRLGLLQVAPVRQSTPTASLEIIYDLKPLDLYIREMAVKTYVRLGIKPNWERQLGSLLKAHLHYLRQQVPEGCHQPLDNITEIKVWKRPYKITIGDGMDTQLAHKSVLDFSCYTDGSLMDGKAGAGSLILQRTKPWLTQSVRMASGTVHQAELLAITNAAKLLAGETGKKILFLVDNQASLKVLAGTNVKFDSVKTTRDALHSLGSTNNVELRWIKAHVGHDGNEAADKAAKKGSTSNRGNQKPLLAKSKAWSLIDMQFRKTWETRWKGLKDHRQSKIFLHGPNKSNASKLLHCQSEVVGRVARLLTGHAHMRRHQAVQDQKTREPTGEINCRLCGEDDDETPAHIVCKCPALNSIRNICMGTFQMDSYEPKWKMSGMIEFARIQEVKNLEE